jgi:RNA polymerase sigma-70 factor, ECF subfamily
MNTIAHRASVTFFRTTAEPLVTRGRSMSVANIQNDTTKRDAELLERFLSGEDSAFDPLYAEYNQRIYAYVARMIGDDDAAKDITQHVWERVIDLRANVEREAVANVGGFLFTLARNLSLDHLRKQKKFTEMDSADHLAQATSSRDDAELVALALRQLPEETREILVLNYYSGYSFEEIAELLGKKPNAIWTRASRARRQLKSIFERLLREGTSPEIRVTQ